MSEKKKRTQEKETVEYREAEKNKPQVIDFNAEAPERERLRNLAELAGKTILIYSFSTQNTRIGPRTEITAEVDGIVERFYSFSTVIQRQLERYKDVFRQGGALRAKVEKRKRYITLAPP